MNELYAGFARVNITPMMGIGLRGYYRVRLAEGVLDDLEINALAIACGDTKALLITIDTCRIFREVALDFKQRISEVTGLPTDAIYMNATHTHTGPHLEKDSDDPLVQEYYQLVYRKIGDVAQFALDDLKPAKMGYGVGQAPRVAFIRRFRMKDGSVRTNPGIGNPDIVAPIGEVDERVNVLRFDREGADSIVLANYGNHPDVISGNKISADWPGHLRREVEQDIPGTKCIFFNGAQGDVNHIDVNRERVESEYMSDSGAWQGYGHSKYMGRALAGTVLQVYDKVKCIPVESIRYKQKTIHVPANVSKPEDMPEAHRIYDLYVQGRQNELPYTGMMLTTIVAEAKRMVTMENGPEYFDMEVSVLAIGSVVFVGIPGEAFTGIGLALKETKGWDMIMPTCQTNGSEGYFPMKDAYDEGGYEARSSRFKSGVAELMIEEGKNLLVEIVNKK